MRPAPAPAPFDQAFDHWLAAQRSPGRLRHASSVAVYQAMWQALSAWCLSQKPPVPLRALDAATLSRYLASRSGMAGPAEPLTARYQWRLLSLVQRVQADHALRQSLPPQLAATELIRHRPALRSANAGSGDDVPAVLADADAAHLMATLSPDTSGAAATPHPRWQSLRDHAAAGLQLGAGLGPGELRALQVDDVELLDSRQPPLPWRLQVPASGSAPAHAVPVAGWCARLLAHWLQRRADEAIPGPWLFPSTRGGKPWGKVAQFESARRLLAAHGIADEGGGSFKLRHTFAVSQLRAGLSADLLARQLGIIDPGVIARYQRLLMTPAPSPHAEPPPDPGKPSPGGSQS